MTLVQFWRILETARAQTDAIDATLSKEPGGYVENSLAVFGGLEAAHSH